MNTSKRSRVAALERAVPPPLYVPDKPPEGFGFTTGAQAIAAGWRFIGSARGGLWCPPVMTQAEWVEKYCTPEARHEQE